MHHLITTEWNKFDVHQKQGHPMAQNHNLRQFDSARNHNSQHFDTTQNHNLRHL